MKSTLAAWLGLDNPTQAFEPRGLSLTPREPADDLCDNINVAPEPSPPLRLSLPPHEKASPSPGRKIRKHTTPGTKRSASEKTTLSKTSPATTPSRKKSHTPSHRAGVAKSQTPKTAPARKLSSARLTSRESSGRDGIAESILSYTLKLKSTPIEESTTSIPTTSSRKRSHILLEDSHSSRHDSCLPGSLKETGAEKPRDADRKTSSDLPTSPKRAKILHESSITLHDSITPSSTPTPQIAATRAAEKSQATKREASTNLPTSPTSAEIQAQRLRGVEREASQGVSASSRRTGIATARVGLDDGRISRGNPNPPSGTATAAWDTHGTKRTLQNSSISPRKARTTPGNSRDTGRSPSTNLPGSPKSTRIVETPVRPQNSRVSSSPKREKIEKASAKLHDSRVSSSNPSSRIEAIAAECRSKAAKSKTPDRPERLKRPDSILRRKTPLKEATEETTDLHERNPLDNSLKTPSQSKSRSERVKVYGSKTPTSISKQAKSPPTVLVAGSKSVSFINRRVHRIGDEHQVKNDGSIRSASESLDELVTDFYTLSPTQSRKSSQQSPTRHRASTQLSQQSEMVEGESSLTNLDGGEREVTRQATVPKSNVNTSFQSISSLSTLPSSSQDSFSSASPRTTQHVTIPKPAVNTSFQSTSSLSTLPPSSQVSFASASQRIWKNGQELVTNSSSDTEELESIAEELDSVDLVDESDDDIEKLIALKQVEIAARQANDVAAQGGIKQEEACLPREQRRQKVKQTPRKPYPTPPKTTDKYSLPSMAKHYKTTAAKEITLKELEEEDRRAEERFRRRKEMEGQRDAVSADQVAAAMGQLDDPSGGGRLKQALDRTDALGEEIEFEFFDSAEETERSRPPNPFLKMRQDKWTDILRNPDSRGYAVPFVADICLKRTLPLELQKWCLTELLYEEREDVSGGYVHILKSCAQHESTSRLITVEVLQDSLLRLGARPDIIDHSGVIPDTSVNGKRPIGHAHGLDNFLLLLASLSAHLDRTTLSKAIHYIALLLADTTMATNISLLTQAQFTISAFLSAPNVDISSLAAPLLQTLAHPILIARLVSLLPARYPDTPAALFARLLAFEHLTSRPAPPAPATFTDPATWPALTALLRSTSFSTRARHADFPTLTARVALFSTALGPGFAAFAWLTAGSADDAAAAAPAETNKNSVASFFFAARRPKKAASSPEQAAYEHAAHQTAALLAALAAGVWNAAGSMARTQARTRIEGVLGRVRGTLVGRQERGG